MSLRRLSVHLAAFLVAAAPFAACTTSKVDDSATVNGEPDKIYALTDAGIEESLRDHMTEVGDNLNLWVPHDDEAACAAQRLVRRFGAERLLSMGYDPQVGGLALAYEPAERSAAVNILEGCIDFSRGLLEMMSAYAKTPIAGAECITRGIETAGLSRQFAESLVAGVEPDPFADDAALGRGVAELLAKCLEADDLDPLLSLEKYPGAFDTESTTTITAPPAAGLVPAGGD